jgi:hypothetical protein
MTSRPGRVLLWSACFYAAVAGAGEILILQPPPGDNASRNARESERAMDKARQHAGKAGTGMTTIIIGDEQPAQKRNLDRTREAAQEASQEAREYLRSSSGDGSVEGTTIMLRPVPVRETERLQQRARSYVAPVNAGVRKDCGGNVGNQIGMIGEGTGAIRGNVLERGSSSVEVQGPCR